MQSKCFAMIPVFALFPHATLMVNPWFQMSTMPRLSMSPDRDQRVFVQIRHLYIEGIAFCTVACICLLRGSNH